MAEFEKNVSRVTLRDQEAMTIADSLAVRDRRGDIDLGFADYIEKQLKERWSAQGYGDLLTFIDAQNQPTVVARREDQNLYDRTGIRQDQDVSYRFFVEGDTHDVTIPYELTGGLGLRLRSAEYSFYDLSDEAACKKAARRDVDGTYVTSLAWLRERYGSTLVSRFPATVPTGYLESETGVVGVRREIAGMSFEKIDWYDAA